MKPREPFLDKVRPVGADASTNTAYGQHQVEKLSVCGLWWIRVPKASGIYRVGTSEGISKYKSIGSNQGRVLLLCNLMQDLT